MCTRQPASVAPDRLTLPDPAVAVMVPPPHEPVSPFGVATTTLAGNVSVNAIPVSGTEFPAGLVMVKLSVERSFGPIATGLNALLIEGGATTTMLAEAVPPVMGTKVPVPSSKVAVTFPLVLFLVPAVVPVTLTESEQEPFAGKFNDATLIVLLPGLSITSTPTVVHVPAKPLGLATTRPLGSVSLTEMFTSAVLEFGFVKEKVREVVPFSGMLAAPNALVMVGGDGGVVTVRLAVLLVAPGPLSLAEIGPVVLFRVAGAVAVACTLTEMKHDPLAMGCGWNWILDGPLSREINPTAGFKLPPARLIEVEPAVAVTTPPQSLLTLGDGAITRPAGKLSVNAIPVSATSVRVGSMAELFGLVMVKLNKDVPFCTVVSGKKTSLMVGGMATLRLAVAVLPVPPLVEVTFPVVLV